MKVVVVVVVVVVVDEDVTEVEMGILLTPGMRPSYRLDISVGELRFANTRGWRVRCDMEGTRPRTREKKQDQGQRDSEKRAARWDGR